jgi:hypothetical protein
MTTKTRLAKLEKDTKTNQARPQDIILGAKKIDYRAGIVPGVPDAPGSIPVRFVDWMERNYDNKE